MNRRTSHTTGRLANVILCAAILLALYVLWTGSTRPSDLAIIGAAALVVSFIFVRGNRAPRVTPKRVAYMIAYIFYLAGAIVRSNLDVARRVVRRRIPIKPGIVEVKTKLASPTGRTVLANSITLTPGTLSVDIRGDRLYIHWIDVADEDIDRATRDIVAGFERYLEVIFG
jgi:multicomponent Na+:H+ antiporter subunit E